MNLPIENQRVREVIDFFTQGNELQFSKEINISQPRINRLFAIDKRNNKYPVVSFEIIQAIINRFVEVNPEWLLTGKGEMLRQPHENHDQNVTIHHGNRKTRDAIIPMQEIPLYNLEATAGLVELFRSSQVVQALDTIKIPNLPNCDGALTVTGDSMYPLLKSGDIIMYKEITVSPQNIYFGEMYLLGVRIDDYEEMVTVKYIKKSELGDDYIQLVSQNQHHSPKDIPLSSVTAMAIVKASIRFNTMF